MRMHASWSLDGTKRMTPETIREFEKAPKSLIKMKGTEVLFADDAVGKMRFIYEAFEDEDALRASAKAILSCEDGGRHIVRALNNLKKIPHLPAMRMARVLYETVRPQWDLLTRVQKCQQVLDAVDEQYEADTAWLDEETEALLDLLEADAATQVILWSAWLGSNLRSSADSGKIIQRQSARRPKTLSKPVYNQLVRTMNDAQERWEYRSAAMYALVGSHAMRPDDAMNFMDAAYTSFPLEALSGVEALSMALELDQAAYAETDAIAEKLAQVRHDKLILREMSKEDFVSAAERIFARQHDLADRALDIALSLQTLDKNDRMMTTIFIDDARRNDFIQMALKYRVLKQLAHTFFEHFCANNTLCVQLSASLVMALAENENADAVMTSRWMDACDAQDTNTLQAALADWMRF